MNDDPTAPRSDASDPTALRSDAGNPTALRSDESDGPAARRREQAVRYGRLAFAALAAWYVGRPVVQPFDYVILRDIILATHEAGHVLFMPFGEFVMVLGGSLFQLIVPCVFIGYFARRHDWYAASILTLWLAFSLTDLSVYIGDARARQLPLLGGDPSSHDWTFLLVRTGLLDQDALIAGLVRAAGVVVYGAAVAGAFYNAWWQDRLQALAASTSALPADIASA